MPNLYNTAGSMIIALKTWSKQYRNDGRRKKKKKENRPKEGGGELEENITYILFPKEHYVTL
jgi:hypothetical protein